MPRPRKPRRIRFAPGVTYFKPRGIPLYALEEATLSFSELEAIRLCDLQGLSQEETAARMGISQPTLNRLLKTARQKIADALVNGKAIRIEQHAFDSRAEHAYQNKQKEVLAGEQDMVGIGLATAGGSHGCLAGGGQELTVQCTGHQKDQS